MSDLPEVGQPHDVIARFLIDWVLIAPMALWVMLGASLGWGLSLFVVEIQSGALIIYGLSCLVAHYESLGLSSWKASGIASFSAKIALRIAYTLAVGISLVIVGGVSAGRVLSARANDNGGNDVVEFVAGFLAPISEVAILAGAAVALCGLLAGIAVTVKRCSLSGGTVS